MKPFITSYCKICDNKVIVNDRLIYYQEKISTFADFAKSLYKLMELSYPKFYKMDSPGKLGFIASELALQETDIAGYPPERVGIVLANASASMDTDLAHQESIRDRTAYYPSPSVFVYTLPNIVIGEISIRHKIKGENAFLISETPDAAMLFDFVKELFDQKRVDACLCGWTELLGSQFTAGVMLAEMLSGGSAIDPENKKRAKPFTIANINQIIKNN